MGSGASLSPESPGGDLRLPASGLKFSQDQLRALNSYVDTLYEEDQKGRISTELESVVESLVQRIVDGAGQRDPRFRCCHLIALHRGKKMRSRSLEYLVTLDSIILTGSNQLQEGPVGFGKVRLNGRDADKWEEFLTPTGYLCRDKVVEKWVELIARCASARGGGGSRVISARAAPLAKPYQYCYLENASPLQTSNDRRLAIVEGAAWVMVRVGAGEAEAKLMLGARVGGCSAASYTGRVPLTHPMALLHYTSAQTGYYAVAVGPPSSVACADRSATWQLWHPTLEACLDAHCSDHSTVGRVAGALNASVDRMREGAYEGTLRLVSRYAVSCALRRRVASCAAYAHSAARCVLSHHASHHFLLVLDSLIFICERGGVAGYIYPVERGCITRRGARGEWLEDAACIKSCLLHLHQVAGEDIPLTPSECLEVALFNKWENLNRESKAAVGSPPNYSKKQLRYLSRAASELVKCKNLVHVENHSTFRANLIQATSIDQEAIEDLVHILAIMLDQARDLYLNNLHARNYVQFDRELSTYRSKKWNKLKGYYDASSACLIDSVRRDPDLHQENLQDDLTLMKQILNWLYKGLKDDKKYLGPVLKPYLDGLFAVSLENAWFLDDFDGKCAKEVEGLRVYCMGVHDGVTEPRMGLLDAAKKLGWAKAMVDFVDKFRHIDFRLVFPTGDGMAISYPIKLPSHQEHSSARVLTLSRRDKAEAKLRLARRSVLGVFENALIGDRHNRRRTEVVEVNHGADGSLNSTPSAKSGNRRLRLGTSGEKRGRSFLSSGTLTARIETEEILSSVKSGSYWRTKPDIIPSTSIQDLSKTEDRRRSEELLKDQRRLEKRSRRNRSVTCYGFPEISITNQSDTKTMRRKYHTLKSLVYSEPVDSIKELRRRPRSAGSTVRNREALSRPSILETLDFINSVKDALCVEESGTSDAEDSSWRLSDECLLGHTAPVNWIAARCSVNNPHLTLAALVPALLNAGRFTILQELCVWLGESSEGALFALHRLARAARSRSSERATNSWRLPEADGIALSPQRYRLRSDYTSGEDAPQPPPLPRVSSKDKIPKRYTDYLPPKRIQDLEQHLNYLEKVNSHLNLTQKLNENYTGILNPIYDVPKNKFDKTVKRSKSLGRSFSTKRLGIEMTRYNLTLGNKSGRRTNDVMTAINGTTGETGIDAKYNFFQRYSSTANVVGDSYKVTRVSID